MIQWEDAWELIEPKIGADGVHALALDPAFPVDVRFLLFRREREIRLNRHRYCELLYVASGEVEYEVQDQIHALAAGDLFVMGSTLMHRMRSLPKGRAKGAVLYFQPDLIVSGDLSGEDLQYLMPFSVQDVGFPHVVPASSGLPAQIFDLMKRTAAELPATSHRARLSVRTYLKMILVLLVNHYTAFRGNEDAQMRRERELERLRPLFAWVDAHFDQPVTVSQAASTVHMSESNFMRFFKRTTGQPFVVWLNRLRVARAERLLRSTDLPIGDISQQVGFGDQSYFGSVFRSVVGMTPREYRRRPE